ncbi:helix-turn-helix transcriptional regulator [Marinicaulis aureus]|uniref:Helix-turn-helix transcriptional regulator n=1 Tax=Hyphococcus aureus TaxID=2666033 RepID=A0ABW1KYN8_9PROT
MLSEALRLLRVFHDMKQGELAERLELSKSYVSEIENGNRTPSFDVIEKYANIFGVPISSIMFFSEQLDAKHGDKAHAGSTRKVIASKILNFLKVIEERTAVHEAP